jgi:hypothetical protein
MEESHLPVITFDDHRASKQRRSGRFAAGEPIRDTDRTQKQPA